MYIPAVLKKVKPQHIERTYDVRGFSDATAFLELLARKSGRLLKGGEADVDGVAKMVLNDFLRGKIPWFTPPPLLEGQEEKKRGVEGRKGALGEMGVVRKAEDRTSSDVLNSTLAESEVPQASTDTVPEDLLDPVIAESTVAETIPENIPGNEGDDFESFDEDGDGPSASEPEEAPSDSEHDDEPSATQLDEARSNSEEECDEGDGSDFSDFGKGGVIASGPKDLFSDPEHYGVGGFGGDLEDSESEDEATESSNELDDKGISIAQPLKRKRTG